mgnify:CR=1 FL=1
MGDVGRIRKFEFRGDRLDVIEWDGRFWLSVRRICDALGLANGRQQKKLRGKPWAMVALVKAVADDGRVRELFCIDVDSLPLWMAGIEARRVHVGLREKLRAYQIEARAAVCAYFVGAAPGPAAELAGHLRRAAAENDGLRAELRWWSALPRAARVSRARRGARVCNEQLRLPL